MRVGPAFSCVLGVGKGAGGGGSVCLAPSVHNE